MIIGNNGIRTRTTQVLISADKPYTRESGWSANFSYTYSHAKQNRDINEHYSFDEAVIGNYPFITSNSVAKHRFVGTGSFDAPWGITLSAKLTIATPLPYNGVLGAGNGVTYNYGESSYPIAGTVRGSKFLVGGKIWGYRDIDIQATKDFVISENDQTKFYIRFDILNVFNWKNFVDYTPTFNANGFSVQYNDTGNISFVPRTARFTAGFKF
jgi:hypothetical protein